MRKRSSYRPKPVMRDAVGYVIAGLRPVASAREEMLLVGLKNHGAVEAVRTGQATREQANFLVNAFNLANALACMGQGADWLPEIEEAQAALLAAGNRPRFGFTGPELQAVNLAMQVHDAQMEDPTTTVQMLEQAMNGLKRLEAQGKVTRIKFTQGQAA